jgi:transcriptional regulator with XRE-family HTH domain
MSYREDELGRVITTLKQLLKNRGLHYADVAEKLGVSERSVQRWFNGDGLTLELLFKLSDLVGVSLAELFSLADAATDNRPRALTEAQEHALASVPLRAFIFTRLLQGWSARELQSACNLSEAAIIEHLLSLERLGLIEVHPGNRVRLLTRRNIEWRKGGAMRVYFNQFAKALVGTMDFGEVDSIWTAESVNLTHRSAMALETKLNALRMEIRSIAESERDIAPHEKLWYSIVFLAYRHSPTSPTDPLGWAFSRNVEPAQAAPPLPSTS